MEIYNSTTILTGLPTLLILMLLVFLYRTRKEKRELLRQLALNRAQLRQTRKKNSGLHSQLKQLNNFKTNLAEAELTTRIQQPRLGESIIRTVPDCPERYQYFKALEQKGMSPDEISTILRISRQETEQLLTLSRIAEKN